MEKKRKPLMLHPIFNRQKTWQTNRKWKSNLLDYILVNAEIFDEHKVTDGISPSYRLIKVKHWDKK